MQTITVERTIPAPARAVFDWCAVTTNYERSWWVLRDRLTLPGTDALYGTGAVRRHLWLVGWFDERVTAFDPPRSLGYVVDRSFPPSRHEGGTMTFEPTAEGTHVTWTTTVQLKLPLVAGPATRVIVAPVLRLVFGRILRACARELASTAG